MKKTKGIIWIIALILIIALIGMVGYGYYRKANWEVKNPIVTIEIQDYGTIQLELYPEKAPETVANFIALANRGFYDGSTFHRIVKDFMIQGGSKGGDGTTGAKISDLKDGGEEKDYTIKGEFLANQVDNTLKMEEGTLAMARSDYTSYDSSLTKESYNSQNSQFFITTKANSNINGYYTTFGKVTNGLDVLHAIENTEVKAADDSAESGNTEVSTPVNPPKITSIRVETNGIDYGLPKTLTPFDFISWYYSHMGTSNQ